ncbi:MAG: hypothetical protein PHQ40_19920 [Anaerolineaceae bacterium]|nr:hypothetical protein [Anaerolineaceae bacterium]
MKKTLMSVLIVLVMLVSVTPAFAKGHPPTNHGQEMKNKNQAEAGIMTPEPKDHPEKNAEKNHGNPHGVRSNFVLFGTLVDVTPANGTVPGTIKVEIISGNRTVHGFEGQEVVIQVPDGAAIKLMQGDGVKWGTLEQLKAGFIGQVVRVHGWVTPKEVDPNATSTATPTSAESKPDDAGVWTARQVYTLSPEAQESMPGDRAEE